MATLMVGYDLNKPDQDYEKLIDYLKSLGTWWHHLDSTWLVVTNMSAKELRDKLKTLIGAADELLVMDVTDDIWATAGFTDKANNWLQQNTVSKQTA
jgi:hypothetical protein